MHSRGLKLGLYTDLGTATCENYPGSYAHLETDAKTFAEWQIDSIKVDGCNINFTDIKDGKNISDKFFFNSITFCHTCALHIG